VKARSFILRCAAFFLLLVFSQKTGVDLLLHNLLHESQDSKSSPLQKDSKNEISYSCSCIDNFLTPFAEAEETFIPVVSATQLAKTVFLPGDAPFHFALFPSLRGPPTTIL
jgi:hypothetical protein